jgi:serine/threonine protein kinase
MCVLSSEVSFLTDLPLIQSHARRPRLYVTFFFSRHVAQDTIQDVIGSLALALHHCHTATAKRSIILHRDLKPENGA